jgi:RimJ/RimL family protein N-acetyltransferase
LFFDLLNTKGLTKMNAVLAEVTASSALESRRRWDGPLLAEHLTEARMAGVELAYDPAQSGWVPFAAADALEDPDPPIWARQSPLVLRPWQPRDLEQFHALLDDTALWQYMVEAMPTPFTRLVAADLIAISNVGSHHEVRAILAGGVPGGQVRILWSGPGLKPDEAEVSYWLGRSFRGRGWASAAVSEMVANAFGSRPGLRRVVAFVHPENFASTRVLRRAGFAPSAARSSDGWLGFACTRPGA